MNADNAPPGYGELAVDRDVVKQPTDEQVHKYVCENWRDLLWLWKQVAFEDAEVLGCYSDTPEETDVLLTVRVRVPWVEVEA